MNNVYKSRLIMAFIIVLVIGVGFQYNKLKDFKKNTLVIDTDFRIALERIVIGIEYLESDKYDEISNMAKLASATGQASALYKLTSHFNENEILNDALLTLNNNISNKSNIRAVIEEEDLKILIPALNKVKANLGDEQAAKELFYLIRKHTVTGAPLA